ncbi:MAG TPA: hypothetical protein P5117_08405, partial [Spirochaetia bacterium]|nr:hypothetical protein [Spirochaetia bacterium]
RKGAPDYAALKRTLDLGRAGETLGIFPEGDRTWDGRPAPLRPGMGKLLRVLDKPVLLARQEGSYLTGPRWAQTERIGRWTVEFRVLSRERVAEEVPEALERGIRDFLAADDLRNPSLREVRFECSAPAAGIGRLLWLCPSCGESDTVAGTGDRVSCRACGAEWTVDGNQRLEAGPGAGGGFADLRDWTDFQRSRLAGRAAAAESLGIPAAGPGPVPEPRKAAESLPDPAGARSITASEGVELRRRTPRGAEPFGRGRLELFRDALVFFPADGGVRAAFDPGRVLYFVDNFNNYCEYSYGSDRYRLVFRGGNAYKWIEALEALRIALPGARPTGDLDLLVPRERAHDFVRLLKANGWRSLGYRDSEHHLSPLVHPRWGEIEVHRLILGVRPPGSRRSFTFDALEERGLLREALELPGNVRVPNRTIL